MTTAHTPDSRAAVNAADRPTQHGRPGPCRRVRMARHRTGIHGLPAVLAGRSTGIQPAVLLRREPGNGGRTVDGHVRGRLHRPTARGHLLRTARRPHRPTQSALLHHRPDGRRDHLDRRLADLRSGGHACAHPVGSPAAAARIRGRRRDQRSRSHVGRIRTRPSGAGSSPPWSGWAPTAAPCSHRRSGPSCWPSWWKATSSHGVGASPSSPAPRSCCSQSGFG